MKKLLTIILLASLTVFCNLAIAKEGNLKSSGGNIIFDWNTVIQPQVIGSYTYQLFFWYSSPALCADGGGATNASNPDDAGNQIIYTSNSSGGTENCWNNIYQIVIRVTSGTAAGKTIKLTDNSYTQPQTNGCTGIIVYNTKSQTLGFQPAYSTCTATIQ